MYIIRTKYTGAKQSVDFSNRFKTSNVCKINQLHKIASWRVKILCVVVKLPNFYYNFIITFLKIEVPVYHLLVQDFITEKVASLFLTLFRKASLTQMFHMMNKINGYS